MALNLGKMAPMILGPCKASILQPSLLFISPLFPHEGD